MSFEELKKKYAAPIKVLFKSRLKGKIKHMIKTILRVTGDREDVNKTQNMDYSLRFVFECQEKDS